MGRREQGNSIQSVVAIDAVPFGATNRISNLPIFPERYSLFGAEACQVFSGAVLFLKRGSVAGSMTLRVIGNSSQVSGLHAE